jgi:hypothetical protein
MAGDRGHSTRRHLLADCLAPRRPPECGEDRVAVARRSIHARRAALFRIFRISLDRAATTGVSFKPFRPSKGRIAIVTDAGWNAVDAAASGATRDAGRALAREHSTARGRTMLFAPAPEFGGPVPGPAKPLAQTGRVRQKRVVLTPRCRRQVARRFGEPNRARSTSFRAATVTRKPDHRGEYAISCKAIACGNAGRFR